MSRPDDLAALNSAVGTYKEKRPFALSERFTIPDSLNMDLENSAGKLGAPFHL